MSLRKRRHRAEYKRLWRAAKRAEAERENPRECLQCQGPMPDRSRLDRWFCSDACRQKNYRENKE